MFSLSSVIYSSTNGQCYFSQTDKFDNVWVINSNEVICFNKQLKRIGTYSNILLGNPSAIDALDPFRVVVFFQNSQLLVLLNNRVVEMAKPILLREKGISYSSAVCRSGKGGFWILDGTYWEIRHYDSGFKSTGERILLDLAFSGSTPIYMIENKGILYIQFEDKAICRYDNYGARMGDLPIKTDSYFSFIDNDIVYRSEGEIYQFNIDRNEIIPFPLSTKCIPAKVQGQFLYFDGRTLSIHKISVENNF